jgi:PASTA domain
VTVTTSFGRSATSAADRFTFEQACVVPKLKGKSLEDAKKALRKAHCRLGKVTGSGHVKHQSRKRGPDLAAGTKVGVVLA